MASIEERRRTERVALVLGFGLTLLGLVGSQFYLGAAQRQSSALADGVATARSHARILRTAHAWDDLFVGIGSTIMVLPQGGGGAGEGAGLVPSLQRRAIERRHDGVRQALEQVALAGAVPLTEALAAYEALATDERRLGTVAALNQAGQFERDLSSLALHGAGQASVEAILRHADWARADAEVTRRGDLLTVVTLLGTSMLLVATLMAETDAVRAAALKGEAGAEDHALALRAMRTALEEARRRLAAERAGPGEPA